MSKKSNIRWRGSDEKAVERAVRNFNAKINRLAKANPELRDALPSKVNKAEIKGSIETRADLNKTINSLQRFTKRGAEKTVEVAPDVKVTKWQQQETKRAVQQFNSKITRLSKDIDPSILPEKVSFEKVLNTVETKQDLARVKEQHENFLKPDAHKLVKSTKGMVLTEWEVEKTKEDQQKANEIKQREREKIESAPVKIGGEEQGTTRAEMGTIKENSLKETSRDPLKMSAKEFELFRKNMDSILDRQARDERKEQMRQNYIKGLTESGFLDADPELLALIEGVDIDTFIRTAETDETATFIFYKDPQAFETRLDYIKSSWESAFNEMNQQEVN